MLRLRIIVYPQQQQQQQGVKVIMVEPQRDGEL